VQAPVGSQGFVNRLAGATMARLHTLGTLQWTRQRSCSFVTQGHALWFFVHREMSKLQSRLKSAAAKKEWLPHYGWTGMVVTFAI
jgi:hypothetical protein